MNKLWRKILIAIGVFIYGNAYGGNVVGIVGSAASNFARGVIDRTADSLEAGLKSGFGIIDEEVCQGDYDEHNCSKFFAQQAGFILRYWQPEKGLRWGHVSLATKKQYLSAWNRLDTTIFSENFTKDYRVKTDRPGNVSFRFYKVNNPKVIEYINENIEKIKKHIKKQGLTMKGIAMFGHYISRNRLAWQDISVEQWTEEAVNCAEVVSAVLVASFAQLKGKTDARGSSFVRELVWDLTNTPYTVFELQGNKFNSVRKNVKLVKFE